MSDLGVREEDFLKDDEFSAFFQAVHGYGPFDWQTRLALDVVFANDWPTVLDVPTGAGKTAVIDIAVFHLALEAHRRAKRRAPVRILFVVDRRLIVDAAHERAETIAKKLETATDGVLGRVAARLRLLAEQDGPPLRVAKLRGGTPKDPDWVRTPAQPTVVVSTVDQVGSRLLFRGYGVSNSMKPIHAGLLGADSLLLLDEAHLSQPFVQTARDSRMFQDSGPWSENRAAAPFKVVTLSATPPPAKGEETPAPAEAEDKSFCLNAEERDEEKLAKRLKASKPARLIEVNARDLIQELADQAWALSKASDADASEGAAGGGKATTVAVVVNRVARARDVFRALAEKGARPLALPDSDSQEPAAPTDQGQADLALLIGRTRELERKSLLDALLPRVKAKPQGDRERSDADVPLFVVATQTIEAGADLDFDAMVTEIAPLDSLRQRFGRLDRMGDYGEAQAVIVAASDQISRKSDDPIYGPALKETWKLLTEQPGTGKVTKKKAKGKGKTQSEESTPPTIDFGVEASEAWIPKGDALAACLAPRPDAPVLLPRDIALWTRTSPLPAVDPEVSLYLHGPGVSGEVDIVWRADIDSGDEAERDWTEEQKWKDRIAVCPPSALEAISVPIDEAKRWLRREARGDIADVERSVDEADDDRRFEARASQRKALRWRGAGNDGTGWIEANRLVPGDVIVVPADAGGCDRWGWAPRSKQPVPDLGRAANREQRGRNILRLTRADLSEDEVALAAGLADLKAADVIAVFEAKLAQGLEEDARAWSKPRVRYDSGNVPLAIEQRALRQRSGGDATSEDDDSIRSVGRVFLNAHCLGVGKRAGGYADMLGLHPDLIEDLGLAGCLHDVGKAHPAFQRLLYGGSELAAVGGALLAKSGCLPDSAAGWRAACRRSGLPKGARHEIASLAVAEAHPDFARAHDPDLVLWLIGTHHGYGRPFFPVASTQTGAAVDWPEPGGEAIAIDHEDDELAVERFRSLAQLTAAWLDLAARVQRRYGPWGLARLEAILRLADHRQSEAEEREAEREEADFSEAAE